MIKDLDQLKGTLIYAFTSLIYYCEKFQLSDNYCNYHAMVSVSKTIYEYEAGNSDKQNR